MCSALPDVCLTPSAPSPVPVPYPNMGMLNQATRVSTKVKFSGKPAVLLNSEIPRSSGDEAGTNGGVVSGVNMGPVVFKKGSSKVRIEGQACVHLTSTTSHNGSNANVPVGQVVAPSQVKVFVAP
jgi:hypothetical protein